MTAPATSRRRRRWGPALVIAAVVLAVGLVWDLAAVLHIERLPVLAGLVGPRNAVTWTLILVGAVLLVVALTVRRVRVLLPVAAAALLVAAASLPVVLARGFDDDRPAAQAAGTVRILSWNINGDLVPPSTIARLAAAEHADVVVLPEITPATTGAGYGPAFARAGLRMTAYPRIGEQPIATVVLVRDGFGAYSPVIGHSGVPWKSAALTPLTAGLPAIVAIHAAQPTLRTNAQWRSDLRWVAARCADPDVIAVGDFNATVDSFGADRLGGCTDAATLRHAASTGSWPTAVPDWAGMPLDHVLAGSDWRVLSWTVIRSEDRSGARHRPVLAVLTRASNRE